MKTFGIDNFFHLSETAVKHPYLPVFLSLIFVLISSSASDMCIDFSRNQNEIVHYLLGIGRT